jgi:hypothetical protein
MIRQSRNLPHLRLGDILTFSDGRSFSLRMLAELPDNPLDVSPLMALGDLEMLLLPTRDQDIVHMLLPVETLPPAAASAKQLCDGAAAFWAPHLPAVGGAMGEVLFRVLLLRSVFAPLVVLDRGGDNIFFLKVGEAPMSSIALTALPASALSATPVSRFSAVVDPNRVPVLDPKKARPLPQTAPRR